MPALSNLKPESIEQELERRQEQIQIELSRRSLLEFTKYTFDGEYEVNWHHEIVADEIDKWIESEEPYNLLINLPPRHGKSELCARKTPPYILGKYPDAPILFSSYSADLADSMSRDAQRIMLSDKYNRIFPETQLVTAGNRKDTEAIKRGLEFTIQEHKGHYKAAGVGGSFTGRGAKYGIIDDPLKGRKEAESKTTRKRVIDWYKSVFRTRLEKGGRILLLCTRWHTWDLAGTLLKESKESSNADQWKVISLPAIFESNRSDTHQRDPRKDGDALWRYKYDESSLEKIKNTVGTYDWHSLYQQNPKPPGGAVIKREWLLNALVDEAPDDLDYVRAWDLAVTENKKNDPTASIQIAKTRQGLYYLRGRIKGYWEYPEAKRIITLTGYHEGVPVGVENYGTQKGFEQDIASDERMKGIPVTGISGGGDKLTRALPWIAKLEAGQMLIEKGSWVSEFIEEAVNFTGIGDEEDDTIDAISIGHKMLNGKAGGFADLGDRF